MLGVLGGMGPLATADFQRKLVLASAAERDQDHVPIIVWGDPRTPDRTQAILHGGPSPLAILQRGARALATVGATAFVIPCNTAHFWFDDIAATVSPLPVLHIVDAVAREAETRAVARLGLLATSGTVAAGIYQRRLFQLGVEILAPAPEAQDRVQAAVTSIKGGQLDRGRALLLPEMDALIERGAGAVVLACTEIPLALSQEPHGKLIDATEALARSALRWWQAQGAGRAPSAS